MKIAICYSGFLRNIEKTHFNILNKFKLKSHEVDYFIHTWDVPEYSLENEYARNNIKPKIMMCESQKKFEINPYYFINANLTASEYSDQLIKSGENKKFYDPPSKENNYCFHKDLELVKFKHYSSYPFNFLSQFYSIHKSLYFKKIYEQNNSIKYDYVIRLRTDICFHTEIDIQSFETSKINVIASAHHKGTDLTVNDHFACSSSDLMDIYGDCFLFIPAYYFTYNIDFIQELYIGHHLRVNNIPIKTVNISTSIIRDGIDKECYNPNFVKDPFY
tara:strand:+ start:1343 stop:2167 length:825 start_codon:yes stop_codon:yes gene_type:complete